MPPETDGVGLSPMKELELENPWLDDQKRKEKHCVACDPGAGFDDPVEPAGGEADFINVDEPLPDLF